MIRENIIEEKIPCGICQTIQKFKTNDDGTESLISEDIVILVDENIFNLQSM